MDTPLFPISHEEVESSLEEVATDLCSKNTDLQEAHVLYENLMNGSVSVHQVCQADVIKRIKNVLMSKIESMKSSVAAVY